MEICSPKQLHNGQPNVVGRGGSVHSGNEGVALNAVQKRIFPEEVLYVIYNTFCTPPENIFTPIVWVGDLRDVRVNAKGVIFNSILYQLLYLKWDEIDVEDFISHEKTSR